LGGSISFLYFLLWYFFSCVFRLFWVASFFGCARMLLALAWLVNILVGGCFVVELGFILVGIYGI